MAKILTISIAAYNVESYIRETLNSLVIPEILDNLEVFVVDDGGSDGTLAIAQEFQKKYPETFHAVHKENGGYGSTVNWSIEHATGKYFKLLDGDDWVDKRGLIELVKNMNLSTAECFVSGAVERNTEGKERLLYPYLEGVGNQILSSDELLSLNVVPVSMWGLSFLTSMLKNNYVDLPKHSLYTDQIFVMQGLTRSTHFQISAQSVYVWRLGRDEQSNNKKSIEKHYEDVIKVADIVNTMYMQATEKYSKDKLSYLLRRASAYYSYSIAMLCRMNHSINNLKLIKHLEKQTAMKYPEIYKNALNARKIQLLRKSFYWLYWIM